LNIVADLRWPANSDLPDGRQILGSLGPGEYLDYGLAVVSRTVSLDYSDVVGRQFRSAGEVRYDDQGHSGPDIGRLTVEELQPLP